MINLLAGIQIQFGNYQPLMEQFIQGCFLNQAPDGASLPQCIAVPMPSVNNFTTGPTAYRYQQQVQFSVYALTDVEVLSAIENLKAAFPYVPDAITLPNGDEIIEIRLGPDWIERSDERVWHGYVLFEFMVQSNLAG